MSYLDGQPLLPAALTDRAVGWFTRALGVAVLAASGAGALSLLTWTASDPSLTQVTSGPTRNLLGAWGAVIADLAMQMLGLAAVFALLPPLVWSLQLASAERILGVRSKLVMAPTAVLLLAGAFSSLPRTASWPLYHSYGGILGDLGVEFLASLLLMLNPDRAWAAAGLFYLAAGLLVLGASLGLAPPRLVPPAVARPTPRRWLEGSLSAGGGLWRWASQWAARSLHGGNAHAAMRERIIPQLDFGTSSDHRSTPQPARDAAEGLDAAASLDLYADDDDGSQAIAGRFAPFANAARAARPASVTLVGAAAAGEAVAEPRAYPRFALSLLKRPPAGQDSERTEGTGHAQAGLLKGILADLGAPGEVKVVCCGPVLSRFEFHPAAAVELEQLAAQTGDIARALGAAAAHVAVLGAGKIEVELAHARRDGVYLRELLGAEAFRSGDAALPLALGKSVDGTATFADLARMPHLLVGGAARSGKASALHAMILSLLYRLAPAQCRLVLADTKMAGFTVYRRLPHLLMPVITSPEAAQAALAGLVREVEQRQRALAQAAVESLEAFNCREGAAQRERAGGPPMPYVVVVIGELIDLAAHAGTALESAMAELARAGRRVGVHVVGATQSPATLAPALRASFAARCAFKVASAAESRAILLLPGAERLLGEGDMLLAAGAQPPLRVHGPLLSEAEVARVADYLGAWRPEGTPAAL